MQGTADVQHSQGSDEDRAMDPREAAQLLERTTRATRRQFNPRPLLVSLVAAGVVVTAFGALWLSVRNQHPYKGPTGPGLAVAYGVLICWIALVVSFRQRVNAGLSGRSVRQERAAGVVLVAALIGVSVFEGVLKSDGVRASIAFGIYPPTAQLIVLGTIGAMMMLTREDWPGFGISLMVILVATGSAFAGPRGVWLSDGIGCLVAVVAGAAAQIWLDRRAPATA